MWDTFMAGINLLVVVSAIAGLVKARRQRRGKVEAGEPAGSTEVILYTVLLVSAAILLPGNLNSLFA